MTEDDPYGHIVETKDRLKANRKWLERWSAGDGQANSPERFRKLEQIREDEAILEALGMSNA